MRRGARAGALGAILVGFLASLVASPSRAFPPQGTVRQAAAVPPPGTDPPAQEEGPAAPAPQSPSILRFDTLLDPAAALDRPAARVDRVPISRAQVFEASLFLFRSDALQSLEQLVVQVLVKREAARLGAFVPRDLVEAQIADARAEIEKTAVPPELGDVTFEDVVRRMFGMDEATFQARLRQFVLTRTFLSFLVRYEEESHDRVLARVLEVGDRGIAEDLRHKLLDGADFAVLARKYSRDASAVEGGKLPPIAADDPHPLAAMVHELAVGEVSEILEIQDGENRYYELVQVYGRKPAVEGTFSDRFEDLDRSIRADPVTDWDIRAWMARLESRYTIDILAADAGT